ncbi:MAG: phosphatase PAP2 family protein [Clostridia bacterium]|nr:phosphatase PAP2 family protein [Clostridia bacterium]
MAFKDYFKKFSFLLPPLFVLISNLTASFVTRPFLGSTHDIATAWDRQIPLVPGFIHIYFLAFVQWAVCIVAVMIIDKEASKRYCTAISLANIISGIIILSFPTVMALRPEEFSGGGAFTQLVGNFIYSADNPPMNALPSLHCLHSFGCMRMVFAAKRIPKSLKIINAVFSFLVFASVLLVRQHYIIDIPAGILVFEIGLLITKLIEKHSKA